MIPDAAYEAARAAYDSVVISRGGHGHRAGHHDAVLAAVDAVAPILIAEGRRQAVAEIVAETHERRRLAADALDRQRDGDDQAEQHKLRFLAQAVALEQIAARVEEGTTTHG